MMQQKLLVSSFKFKQTFSRQQPRPSSDTNGKRNVIHQKLYISSKEVHHISGQSLKWWWLLKLNFSTTALQCTNMVLQLNSCLQTTHMQVHTHTIVMALSAFIQANQRVMEHIFYRPNTLTEADPTESMQ